MGLVQGSSSGGWDAAEPIRNDSIHLLNSVRVVIQEVRHQLLRQGGSHRALVLREKLVHSTVHGGRAKAPLALQVAHATQVPCDKGEVHAVSGVRGEAQDGEQRVWEGARHRICREPLPRRALSSPWVGICSNGLVVKLPQQNPKCVNVGLFAEVALLGDLGSGVVGGARVHPCQKGAGFGHMGRKAEIRDLDHHSQRPLVLIGGQQDVVGLKVAVDDAVLVEILHAQGGLVGEGQNRSEVRKAVWLEEVTAGQVLRGQGAKEILRRDEQSYRATGPKGDAGITKAKHGVQAVPAACIL